MEALRYDPHYTVEDYLGWEGDWELWHGRAVAMAPSPGIPHQDVAGNLFAAIRDGLKRQGCHCRVRYELDWKLSPDTVLRPDLVVSCDDDEAGPFVLKPPTLIVEVLSPTSGHRDKVFKREAYAERGVRFYVIADPKKRELLSLHLRGDGDYEEGEPVFDLHGGCRLTLNPVDAWDGLPDLD